MTIEVSATAAPAAHPSRRRAARRLTAAAVALVLCGGGGWLTYAAHYQPLGQGGLVADAHGHVAIASDGLTDTGYLVTGPAGSRGEVAYALSNDGSFAIRVLGVDRLPSGLTAGWTRDGAGPEHGTSPFPVTVRPGTGVTVWVAVTKPRCQPNTTLSMPRLTVRWSALGFRHVRVVELPGSVEDVHGLPIYLCYPASALRRVEPTS
jgi:hypothetical protein